jgi:hypothetical protein
MLRLAILATLAPGPAFAHDAFGDLGPFYASLLHPLADPLQGALLLGTAAFLAGRPLSTVRPTLPIFAAAAALGYAALVMRPDLVVSPLMAGGVALVAGLAAMLPDPFVPRLPGFALVAATGALAGLASGASQAGTALQASLGTFVGIAALATLAWFALETAGRRFTPIVPKVAGSWVAAIGILVAAFSL